MARRTSSAPRGESKPFPSSAPRGDAKPSPAAASASVPPKGKASAGTSSWVPVKTHSINNEEWGMYKNDDGWWLLKLTQQGLQGEDSDDVEWKVMPDEEGKYTILRKTWTRPEYSGWFKAKPFFRTLMELARHVIPPKSAHYKERLDNIQAKIDARPTDYNVDYDEWRLPMKVEKDLLEIFPGATDEPYVECDETNEGYFHITMVIERGTYAEKEQWVASAEVDKQRYQQELASYVPPPGYDPTGNAIVQNATRARKGPGRPKGSGKKNPKGPGAPKRNGNAYLFFSKHIRPIVQQEFPGIDFAAMSRIMGERYRALTPEEKKPFEEMALKDKVRYENENQQFLAAQGPGAPKRARNAYIFFTNHMRPIVQQEFPGIKTEEMGRITGERYRALTPEEKKPFEEMALKDKVRYENENQQFLAAQEPEEVQHPSDAVKAIVIADKVRAYGAFPALKVIPTEDKGTADDVDEAVQVFFSAHGDEARQTKFGSSNFDGADKAKIMASLNCAIKRQRSKLGIIEQEKEAKKKEREEVSVSIANGEIKLQCEPQSWLVAQMRKEDKVRVYEPSSGAKLVPVKGKGTQSDVERAVEDFFHAYDDRKDLQKEKFGSTSYGVANKALIEKDLCQAFRSDTVFKSGLEKKRRLDAINEEIERIPKRQELNPTASGHGNGEGILAGSLVPTDSSTIIGGGNGHAFHHSFEVPALSAVGEGILAGSLVPPDSSTIIGGGNGHAFEV